MYMYIHTCLYANCHGNPHAVNTTQFFSQCHGVAVVQSQTAIHWVTVHTEEPSIAQLLEQLQTKKTTENETDCLSVSNTQHQIQWNL